MALLSITPWVPSNMRRKCKVTSLLRPALHERTQRSYHQTSPEVRVPPGLLLVERQLELGVYCLSRFGFWGVRRMPPLLTSHRCKFGPSCSLSRHFAFHGQTAGQRGILTPRRPAEIWPAKGRRPATRTQPLALGPLVACEALAGSIQKLYNLYPSDSLHARKLGAMKVEGGMSDRFLCASGQRQSDHRPALWCSSRPARNLSRFVLPKF